MNQLLRYFGTLQALCINYYAPYTSKTHRFKNSITSWRIASQRRIYAAPAKETTAPRHAMPLKPFVVCLAARTTMQAGTENAQHLNANVIDSTNNTQRMQCRYSGYEAIPSHIWLTLSPQCEEGKRENLSRDKGIMAGGRATH